MVQLQTKHVNVNLVCPSCQSEAKTIHHCLFSCPVAQLVWNRVGIDSRRNQSQVGDANPARKPKNGIRSLDSEVDVLYFNPKLTPFKPFWISDPSQLS
ncbi:hypothetical protein F8388_002497 [Cannabis sativa]|uniref:Reverse transcriptase zinc-binding domain-containing protein n=1 Tax=Cannabis sativa TaxID=3483 RepID=A0A7J6DUK2_CANSA|nr:hypothetical protein F8388_002497 [Cannabis sativa]